VEQHLLFPLVLVVLVKNFLLALELIMLAVVAVAVLLALVAVVVQVAVARVQQRLAALLVHQIQVAVAVVDIQARVAVVQALSLFVMPTLIQTLRALAVD